MKSSVGLALYPFNASIFKDLHRPTDLSFTAGSVITDIKENESGWWEGSCQNLHGSFPSNYVSIAPIGKAICIHNYYASKLDELNIKKGDDVIIYEKRNSGWLRVMCNGKGGLVPPTHIREVKATSNLQTSNVRPASPTKSHAPAPSYSNPTQNQPQSTQTGMGGLKPYGNQVKKPINSPSRGPPAPATSGPPPMPATTGPPPMPSSAGGGGYKAPAQKSPAVRPAKPVAPQGNKKIQRKKQKKHNN